MSEPKLTIDGLCQRPAMLTAADLAALPAEHQVSDVSQIDPKRPGTAVTLAGLLEHVEVHADAKYIGLHAARDDFHASIPLDAVRTRGLVIYQLQGQPLAEKSGGPFRFYIRDYATCHADDVDECANVKFVNHIELTAEKGFDNRPEDEAEHAALHEKEQH